MKHILTVVALLVTVSSFAQQERPITLNEAIELGVKNSKQLKISKAKIEEASAVTKQAEQKRLPDASVSGSYLRLTNVNIDMKSKGSGSGSGSGGSGTSNGSPKVSQAMYGILNVGLPLYAGGRIRYGIESAQFLEKAAQLDAENDKEEIIQNTIEAYVNLYKAKKAVDVVRKNLEDAKARVGDLSNLEKNGLLAKNDLLKAELQTNNIELTLTDAENGLQLANINMNILLGLPETTVLVQDTSLVDQKLSVKPLDDYLQSAYNNRKDVASLDLKREAAQSSVKAIRGEMLPSVQLTGGYIAADIPKLVTITNAANIGVGVSYSIGSLWKNKAKVQEAEARVDQVMATKELINDQIKLEVNKAYLDYLTGEKKIEVSGKAIEQANENSRIVNNKFKNSLATTTDLTDAQLASLVAEINFVTAKADAIVAYYKLLQVSGQNQSIK